MKTMTEGYDTQPISGMTYTVLSGTLNPSIPYHTIPYHTRPKSRTERPRKTKIGTEVADVTRDSDITSKVQNSKVKVTRPLYSPPC